MKIFREVPVGGGKRAMKEGEFYIRRDGVPRGKVELESDFA